MMLESIFEEICLYLDDQLTKRAMELFDNRDLSKLSVNHADYLEVIKKKGSPTLSDIAQELNYSKPSVTIMVNKLIDQGFVNKVQSNEDKRVFYVELTDLGKDLIDMQLYIYREFASRLEKVLEGQDIKKLADLLNKGLRIIKDE